MNLNGWNDEMFRHMCILSGCDYLPNIPKVGIKRAYNLVKQKRYIKNVSIKENIYIYITTIVL